MIGDTFESSILQLRSTAVFLKTALENDPSDVRIDVIRLSAERLKALAEAYLELADREHLRRLNTEDVYEYAPGDWMQ